MISTVGEVIMVSTSTTMVVNIVSVVGKQEVLVICNADVIEAV
jgi:hypothetical protein